MKKIKPEILAPAGDLEKLIFALQYGADAVYLGGKEFSLRAKAGNFSSEELAEGIKIAHDLGKKVYLTVNIFAHNRDLPFLPQYLEQAQSLGIDALIISDPGIFALATQYAPDIPIHISTQANNTNWQSARFWRQAGAKRVVLGRELSLSEVAEISDLGQIETEIFIHGAICISYSGRCLLSNFLNERDANQGNCTHPCRWKYYLQEEKRPDQYFPIDEDNRGTYIMNSKDLCLLPHIKELLQTGVCSWKIEGRNKSAYYVANTVRIYRHALDKAWEQGDDYLVDAHDLEELEKISHRQYTSAFAVKKPDGNDYRYDNGASDRGYDFAAVALKQEDNRLYLQQRNHLALGDEIEILLPDGRNIALLLEAIYDENNLPIDKAPHPKQAISIPFSGEKLPLPAIIRRKQRY